MPREHSTSLPLPHEPITKARVLQVLDHAPLSADEVAQVCTTAAASTAFWTPTPRSLLRFLKAHFLAAGIVALTVGAIFFVAANWTALSGATRIGLVGLSIFALSLTSLRLTLTTASGRACLALAGLLIGPLLAVYGQVYQTGADAYDLFVAWALLLTPFSLLVRWPALYVVQVVLVELAVTLFASQRLGLDFGEDWPVNYVLVGLNLVFLVGVEWRARRQERAARTMPRAFALVTYLFAAAPALVLVSDHSWHHAVQRAGFGMHMLALVLSTIAMFAFYVRRPRDIFPLSLSLGGVVWFVAALLESARVFSGRSANQVLVGAFILVSSLVGVLFLRRLYEREDDDPADDEDRFSLQRLLSRRPERLTVAGFFDRAGIDLETRGVLSALRVPPEFPLSVRVVMALGIWVGAAFFVALLKWTGVLDWAKPLQLLLAGLCFAAAAVVSRTRWHDVRVHLTVVSVVFGEVLLGSVFERVDHFAFLFAGIQLLIIAVVRNPLTRFFASLSMLFALCIGVLDTFGKEPHLLGALTAGIALVGIAAFGARDRLLRWPVTRRVFRPVAFAFVGFGLALAFGLQRVAGAEGSEAWAWIWLPLVAATVWVAAKAHHLRARGEPYPESKFLGWLAGVILLGLVVAAVTQPLVGLGIAVMALGHLVRERLVYFLGAATAAAELFTWYYELSATLLIKSALLVALGAVLLLCRYALQRAFDTDDERVARDPAPMSYGQAAQGSAVVPAVVAPARRHRGWFAGPRPVAAVSLSTALALFVPLGLSVHKELIVRSGDVVRFELRPTDPRSLMQGDYMTLRYSLDASASALVSDADSVGCDLPRLPLDVDPVTRVARVPGLTPFTCDLRPDHAADRVSIKYHWTNHHRAVTFAPHSYFFAEGQGATYARARYAEFKVSDAGTMVLTGLLDEHRVRLVDQDWPTKD